MEQIKKNFQNGMKLINEMDKYFERWKKIDGYDNYSVSTFGRVRNDKTKNLFNLQVKNGYYFTRLHKNNKSKNFYVHRLVANTFLKNLSDKSCVDHIDNNRLNSNISNLRWATKSENAMNKPKPLNNTSGIVGVCYDKKRNKWCAEIMIDKKKTHIGRYNTIEEAKQARIKKANELFGNFVHSSEKL